MSGTIPGAVIVLESAGVIGRGLVAAAIEAGYPVVAVDPQPAALADLGAAGAQAPLVLVRGAARSEADARALAVQLRALDRPLAGLLAAVDAGALRGRLLDQPVEATCAALGQALAPQLAAARHLLPLLSERGRRGGAVLVGGPGGLHPWAGYGQRSLAEASLRMLARILHDEARPQGVRLQLLSVDTPTCGLHAGPPRAHWPSALEIGQQAVRLLASGGPGGAVVEFARAQPMPIPAARAAPRPAPFTASAPAPQAPDSDLSLLPSGCLQDVRKLLGRFERSPVNRTRANKEAFPQ